MYTFARLPVLPRRALRRSATTLTCSLSLPHLTPPRHLSSKRLYVVLSDLHVKRESVSTCLQALHFAHEEARKRDAAVLFLGDFWHARGALPVEPLNLVLQELQRWQVPVVMIPGNHDLVSRSGNGVSLVPLATTLGDANCLLITRPSVCLDALWLPYMHDVSKLKAVLREAGDEAHDIRAVFCHVEVAGARLANRIISPTSSRSVAPTDFPPKVPVYSGHLHRPHALAGNIRYVGSPYEVSASEAGQEKSLLVLDREAGWEVVDNIPLSIGARHFTIDAHAKDPLPDFRAGDRIKVQTRTQGDAELKRLVNELREQGMRVQVQLVSDDSVSSAAADGNADPLKPAEPRISPGALSNVDLFRQYAEIKKLHPKVTRAGEDILNEFGAKGNIAQASVSGKDVVMEWESVTLRGYGSFLKEVTYPLRNRGLVLVTGRDCDDDEVLTGRTNGTGKTTLVMSALWAITGRTDARPDGSVEKGVSLEMVHDDAKDCEVTVRLSLRGERACSEVRDIMIAEEREKAKLNLSDFEHGRDPLHVVVSRTSVKTGSAAKTRSYRQGLRLSVNGVDLTCLDVKETQSRIDRLVNGDLLPHTVFFGQHMGAGRGLVDSTDRTLKDHLALVFPLDVWREGRKRAREKFNHMQDTLLTSEATLDAAKAVLLRLSLSEASAREQCALFEERRAEKVSRVAESLARILAEGSRWEEDSVAYFESSAFDLDDLNSKIEDCKQAIRRLNEEPDCAVDVPLAAAATELARAVAAVESAEESYRRAVSLQAKSVDWEKDRKGRAERIVSSIELTRQELNRMQGYGALESEWKSATAELRECDAKFQELVNINIQNASNTSVPDFADSLSAVRSALSEITTFKEERVRLQTALDKIAERLAESQNVALVSEQVSDAGGAFAGLPTLSSNTVSCESCLRPFDGDLYVEARAKLEREGASIADAIGMLDGKQFQAQSRYEQAIVVLNEQIGRQKLSIAERRRAANEMFGRVRAIREAKTMLAREVEEFSNKRRDIAKETNMYLNELLDMMPDGVEFDSGSDAQARQAVSLSGHMAEVSRERLSAAQLSYDNVLEDAQREERRRSEEASKRAYLQTQIDELVQLQSRCRILESEKLSILSEVNPYEESSRLLAEEFRTEALKVEEKAHAFSEVKDAAQVLKSLDVAFGPRGVPSFVLEEGLTWLEKLTSVYLNKLSDGELMLQIRAFSDYKSSTRADSDNKEIISKKVFLRKRDSDLHVRERTLRQLSGGQRRRCSMAFALAFADLAHERAGFQSSLMVLDEVLQALDEDGRQRVAKMLPQVLKGRSSVLVVTQDEAPELGGVAHGGIDVVMRRGEESTVSIDGKVLEDEGQEPGDCSAK